MTSKGDGPNRFEARPTRSEGAEKLPTPPRRRRPASMIPVDEALRIVLSVAERLPPVAVPLHEALGLILAEDVRAPDPLPPYRASIKASA